MAVYKDQILKAAEHLRHFQLNSDLFRNVSNEDLEASLLKVVSWYESLKQKEPIIVKNIFSREQLMSQYNL